MRIPLSPDAYPHILTRVKQAGFTVFESVDYDINIIGERNPNGEPDRFDDWIHICYLEGGSWQWHAYKCTTDAGLYYLRNGNTAILIHDRQYRGAYMLGLHRGQYEALVQRGNEVCVWRDRNADNVHDYGQNEECGYFGINIHRASQITVSQSVDQYSAGCQVIQDPDEYYDFIQRCKLQIEHNGWEKFTYTLIMGE